MMISSLVSETVRIHLGEERRGMREEGGKEETNKSRSQT
jgi:hypothetical protein